MKRYSLAILLFGGMLLMVGCSNPKAEIIPIDSSQLSKIAPSVQKLSEAERGLFAGYVMRKTVAGSFGGEGLKSGTTIGQAIEDQKQFVAEQERKAEEERQLKAKIERERVVKQKDFDNTIAVAFVGKKIIPRDIYNGQYQAQVKILLGFKNKSSKEIAGIKGKCRFLDMFGDEVRSVNLSYDGGVMAGKTKEWAGYIDINQFSNEDLQFAQVEQSKLKFVFEPDAIIFKDGTKLEMPEYI
jgi:hypothetical protein